MIPFWRNTPVKTDLLFWYVLHVAYGKKTNMLKNFKLTIDW